MTIAYTLANKLDKALKAYEKAHAWRELFALATTVKRSKDEIIDMSGRVAGEFTFRCYICRLLD
jgi:elongator complex protein 1